MSLFHLYVLVSHSYNIHMYLYVIRISLVCTRMSYVCHSCGLACHSYITCMSLVCIRMSFVCRSYVFACHSYVTRMCRMYSYTILMSLVCISTMNLFCILSFFLKRFWLHKFKNFLPFVAIHKGSSVWLVQYCLSDIRLTCHFFDLIYVLSISIIAVVNSPTTK